MNHPDHSFIAQDAARNKHHVLVYRDEQGESFLSVHGEPVTPLGDGVYEVNSEAGHHVKWKTLDKAAPGFNPTPGEDSPAVETAAPPAPADPELPA